MKSLLVIWLCGFSLGLGNVSLLSKLITNSEIAHQAERRGCSDPGPFAMDYSDYWRCSSDSMNCFNSIVQKMMDSVHSPTCHKATCLAQVDLKYGPKLMEQMALRPPRDTPAERDACVQAKWSDEMDYVANMIIQKAKKCSVDYVGLFALFDKVQQLLPLEDLCILAGPPATSNLTGQKV